MGKLRRLDIKIVFDRDYESEESIMTEIESWEGVEDAVVLGSYDASKEVKGEWDD